MQMEFIPYASQEAGNPLFQKEARRRFQQDGVVGGGASSRALFRSVNATLRESYEMRAWFVFSVLQNARCVVFNSEH